MSKIEKTLELNITNELLTLADSFWWYLSANTLKRYWRPSWRLPFLPHPKAYVTGLPINLEGRAGGGYDVCLISPSIMGSNDRAVFMQFKAGEHKEFHTVNKSIFYGSAAAPKPHVEFTFNNNGKKNQHKLLQGLALAKAGLGHPVLYCFPRITSDQQVRDNAGKLLHKTSFISISDIDAKAAINKVTIKVGTKHKFRADYNDYNINEVNFFFFFYDGPDQTKNFIAEIVSVRVMRALEVLKSYSKQLPTIYMSSVAEAFVQYIRYLADYFGLDFRNERQRILDAVKSKKLKYILARMKETEEINIEMKSEVYSERQSEIFYTILSELNPYFNLLDAANLNQIESIPAAPSNFTFELNSNGLRIGFEDEVSTEDFNDISYSIL